MNTSLCSPSSLNSSNTHSSAGWINTKSEEFSSPIKPLATSRKPRRRTNKKEQAVLEETFQAVHHPTSEIKEQLVRELDMSLRTVQIWFQNRRQSLKKKKYQPLIVPRDLDVDNKDHKTKKKRNFTILKLNCRASKNSQISWHYESKKDLKKNSSLVVEGDDLSSSKKFKPSPLLSPSDSISNYGGLEAYESGPRNYGVTPCYSFVDCINSGTSKPQEILAHSDLSSHFYSPNILNSPVSESVSSIEDHPSPSTALSETKDLREYFQLPPIRNMKTEGLDSHIVHNDESCSLPPLKHLPFDFAGKIFGFN